MKPTGRLIVLFFIINLIPKSSNAQIEAEILEKKEFYKFQLENLSADKALKIPFETLQLFDSRNDTTDIGYHSNFKGKITRFNFEESTTKELTSWVNNYLKIDNRAASGNGLFLYLKKLRISSQLNPVVFENGHEGQAKNGWQKGVVIKMELYLKKNDSFYPLYRFDSCINIDERLPQSAGIFITEAMTAALLKLFTIDINAASHGRKLTIDDILLRNKKDQTAGILIDTSHKKGVYANFDEFKKNTPSIADFKFEKGAKGDMLYVTENGTESPFRTAWGFCDGKNIFINSGDKYSMLLITGNTFYFQGIKSFTKSTNMDFWHFSALGGIAGTNRETSSFNMNLNYYQIDMETGKIY